MEWQTITGIIAIAGLSMTFAGFWMNISKQITEAKSDAKAAREVIAAGVKEAKDAASAAIEEAKSSGLRGVQANLKIDTLQANLSDFKEYAAREYVDRDRLREFTEHHETQYTGLKDDLRGITQRLDKLLERGFPPVNA